MLVLGTLVLGTLVLGPSWKLVLGPGVSWAFRVPIFVALWTEDLKIVQSHAVE